MQHTPATHTHAIDPVCGMTVDPARAAGSSTYGGATYFFCNPHCKAKFDANPEQYAGARDTGSFAASVAREDVGAGGGGSWICPMDPEVQLSGPGPCPKCGMALERAE
ncbi:MAG TPA: YHS domain-containing protein, partial [Thermoanaerobaculia bacterium]|nr:YHS domain-containing protein [Thermoanaerobaculia bacterium]